METKWFYFVLERQTQKVLGFNLTEAEKDELFYHLDTPSGHKKSDGRSYGALLFKVNTQAELEKVLALRQFFKNCNEYSYVIVTDTNKWVATGYKETEKQLLNSIEDAKENCLDAEVFFIYETTSKSMIV